LKEDVPGVKVFMAESGPRQDADERTGGLQGIQALSGSPRTLATGIEEGLH